MDPTRNEIGPVVVWMPITIGIMSGEKLKYVDNDNNRYVCLLVCPSVANKFYAVLLSLLFILLQCVGFLGKGC